MSAHRLCRHRLPLIGTAPGVASCIHCGAAFSISADGQSIIGPLPDPPAPPEWHPTRSREILWPAHAMTLPPPPPRRDHNRLTFRGSSTVDILRERCQKCDHCDHTVSVTLSSDDAQPITINEPYAEVFWQVAKDQTRHL